MHSRSIPQHALRLLVGVTPQQPIVTSTLLRRCFASIKRSDPELIVDQDARATAAVSRAATLRTPSGIAAPDLTNYYTIFRRTIPHGPPPSSPFEISPHQLRREFLRLQNALHPDKFPAGSEKQHAEALSMRINEAYRTLLDPLSRAQYLLRERYGIDVTAETGQTEGQEQMDPQILMQVMEVQETIEELATAQKEAAEAVIARLKKENQARLDGCVERIGQAFDKGDIETARRESVQLRFWYSIEQGLKDWEPGRPEIRIVH